MFGIFKKRRREKPSLLSPIWSKVGQILDKLHTRWAEYLGERVKGWSRNKLKVALAVFCLIQGGACIYTLLGVFHKSVPDTTVKQISIPSHVIQRDTLNTDMQEAVISKMEFQRFKAFRLYMDSLQRDPNGQLVYDSIIKARPGLLDSVSMLESIYQQQLRR